MTKFGRIAVLLLLLPLAVLLQVTKYPQLEGAIAALVALLIGDLLLSPVLTARQALGLGLTLLLGGAVAIYAMLSLEILLLWHFGLVASLPLSLYLSTPTLMYWYIIVMSTGERPSPLQIAWLLSWSVVFAAGHVRQPLVNAFMWLAAAAIMALGLLVYWRKKSPTA